MVMRAGEAFDWNRVSFILEAVDAKNGREKSGTAVWTRTCRFPFFQAHGRALDTFVEEHQDRSKNALQKSLEAAYNSWVEELKADQAQFVADRILTLVLQSLSYILFFLPPMSILSA